MFGEEAVRRRGLVQRGLYKDFGGEDFNLNKQVGSWERREEGLFWEVGEL